MAIAGFSNYLENKVLDHVFGGTPYTAPATVYVSLHTADPDEDGSGAEVTGGGYARAAASFGSVSNGQIATDAIIVYTNMPASAVTHMGMWDASTGGNFLGGAALGSTKNFDAGDEAEFAAGALIVTLN